MRIRRRHMGRGSRGGKTVEGGSAVDASVFAAHSVSSAGAGHGSRTGQHAASSKQQAASSRIKGRARAVVRTSLALVEW